MPQNMPVHPKDKDKISTDDESLSRTARHKRGRIRIEDLVAEMPADYVVEELDWGEPVGKEILDE